MCVVLGWSVIYFLRSALCDLREHLPVDVPASFFFLKDGTQVFFFSIMLKQIVNV